MGFTVSVEADYRAGILATSGGGKAVFAFLSGLSYFCLPDAAKDNADSDLEAWDEWFQQLEILAKQPLCQTCSPLLESMWGDGGDSTEYLEDEYEWYCKRGANSGIHITEDQFKAMLIEGEKHWIEIEMVRNCVKFLIDLFKYSPVESLEAIYVPEDTIPDFESLYETLEIFAKQRYGVVRLNFS